MNLRNAKAIAERAQRYAAAVKRQDPILYAIYQRIAENEWARIRRYEQAPARELAAA